MMVLNQKCSECDVIPMKFTDRKAGSKDDMLCRVMSSNRRNQERMRRERIEANRSVLRSYRIKRNGKK